MAVDYTFTDADYQELPIQEFLEVSDIFVNYQLGSHFELTETGSGGGGNNSTRPVVGQMFPRGY